MPLPLAFSLDPPRPDPASKIRLRRYISRHTAFNLTRPEKSMLLLAPLTREQGGYGTCRAQVFSGKDDPDYLAILAALEEGKQKLEELGRFDMPTFRPRVDWVREMIRFGILPEDHDPRTRVDVYAVERKYWESLWYRPE